MTEDTEIEDSKPVEDEKEQIIKAIGGWGKYQLQRCSLILIIIWLPASFHLLNMVYYTAHTDFKCRRPLNSSYSMLEWEALYKYDNDSSGTPQLDPCWIKNKDFESSGEEFIKCTDWEHDTSFWEKTIIMEFDLVCDREPYKKFTQQMTFFGLMCGVFSGGLLSDRYGRRPTMMGLLLLVVVSGTASSFTTNYPSFLLSVWFTGFSSLGYGTVMYCWMMEHISGRHKTILGACPHYCFGFWGLMTALICYLVPNWRHLQLIFSVPCLVLGLAYFYIPESARWLLLNGRKTEAEQLCRTIAKVNGRDLGPDFKLTVKAISQDSNSKDVKQRGQGLLGFLQLFRSPNLCKKTLINYYMWFSTALIYYGLTLNSNSLGASLFVYQAVGKALEFPSITLVIFLLLKAGRRITLMVFYTICGLSLILTMAIPLNTFPHEWPIVTLNLLGRVCAIGTLAVCYIYSSEIFPTVVRNVGLGTSSVCARAGPMIAPFIAGLSVFDARIPTTVFGVVALAAAFLVTFLPETSNTPLPDTIEDSEELGNGDTFWNQFKKPKQDVTVSFKKTNSDASLSVRQC